MCFLFSLIPATFWVTVGYFVLFSSRKGERGIRIFGIILSIWIFIVAIAFIVCGIYMTISCQCPTDVMNRVLNFLTRKNA